MAKKSRYKGKRGERQVASLLKEHGFDAHRGAQHRGGPDSPDVVGLPGFHIEVKYTEALRLYDAMEQSKRDAAYGEVPTVWHRRNGRRWVVILDAEDFLRMLSDN